MDHVLNDQFVVIGNSLSYDLNCSDLDDDSLTYYDDTNLFDINSSTGLIEDTPVSNETGSYEIEIVCGDGINNGSNSFTYTISEGEEETPSTGGGTTAITSVECTSNEDCIAGQICLDENCILPDCSLDEECSLDEKCVENKCIKLFDLRVLDIVDPSVTVGEEIEFTYYVLAMSEIDNDVTITYWLDDGKDIPLSPDLSVNCGDGYVTGSEECDLGEKNTNIACISEYDSSCSYCNLDCKLNNVRGPYCGDNVCDKEEDAFICSEDCGLPSLGSRIINAFKNIFKFTGFTVVGMVNQDVVYVGEIGDELELSSSLYVPTEVEPGTYELHIKLNYAGSEVEAIKTVEILESEEPELAPMEEEVSIFKYIYLGFLIIAVFVLLYLIFRAYKEIRKLSRRISRLKKPRPRKKVPRNRKRKTN